MKNFSSKKKGNFHRSSNRSLVGIIVGVVILLLCIFVARDILGSVFVRVTEPLLYIRVWMAESSSALPSYIRDRHSLIERTEALEDEVRSLQYASESNTVLEAENTTLRELLGSGTEHARIAAGVIGRPPFIPYDTLLLDVGVRDGVVENAVVYYADDHAIGVVSRVYEQSALVTLFSTPGVQTTVYVLGPDIYTTAYGEGGGVVRVSVPQGVVITEGDMVLMPALERGILGTVRSIESTEAQPEQRAYITLTDSLQSVQIVAVSREPQQYVSFEEAQQHVETQTMELFIVPVPDDILIEEATSTSSEMEQATTIGL